MDSVPILVRKVWRDSQESTARMMNVMPETNTSAQLFIPPVKCLYTKSMLMC